MLLFSFADIVLCPTELRAQWRIISRGASCFPARRFLELASGGSTGWGTTGLIGPTSGGPSLVRTLERIPHVTTPRLFFVVIYTVYIYLYIYTC